MWNDFSLRTRLFLPLGAMFLIAVIVGAALLAAFARRQLIDENEPAMLSAQRVAMALNAALADSDQPRRVLDAFARGLGADDSIRYRSKEAGAVEPLRPRASHDNVPDWFVAVFQLPGVFSSYPVRIAGTEVGEIVFAPDLSAEIYEKWVGFLAIVTAAVVLTIVTAIIAFVNATTALNPLRALGEGLTRMRQGDYHTQIPVRGPPEIRQSCEEANRLAGALSALSKTNADLMRRLVTLQDDERRDLARELHDELGPLLFGVRANAVALVDAPGGDRNATAAAADSVMQAVDNVQSASRRILERLRPLHLRDLGLKMSLESILRDAGQQASDLVISSEFDASIDGVDDTLAQTAYRVVQEAVTNVLRHAKATSLNVRVVLEAGVLLISIADDGVGLGSDLRFGRGLIGMRERVRALRGSFQLAAVGGTQVVCRLPLEIPAE